LRHSSWRLSKSTLSDSSSKRTASSARSFIDLGAEEIAAAAHALFISMAVFFGHEGRI
jgi:hypothetical protein